VRAAIGALVLQLHGNAVLVVEDVEGAGDDAGGAAGAQPRGHHLVVQVEPLRLVGRRRHRREHIEHRSHACATTARETV